VRERLLICCAALLAFGGVVSGRFVFDDFALLTSPVITAPAGWAQCWRILQTRPLTWFTFWISYRLNGANPLGWHIVSLALHLVVAVLVWDLFKRLIPARAAFIAAIIFAIHPMVTEPVAYVFARGTLLGALFSLLAIRFWIAERPWIGALCFTAAMLAKEEYAAVPLLILLLDYSRGKRPNWRPLGAMFLIGLTLGLRTVWATFVVPGSQAGPQAGISPGGYLLAQGSTTISYLRRFLLPWGFSVDYDDTRPSLVLAIAAWIAIAALVWIACTRLRNLQAGFWVLAGLLLLMPSSSIFPAADLASDHRMYLPLFALAACAGLLLSRVNYGVIACIAISLIAISIRYTYVWMSPERLWREAVLESPRKLRPRLQLARSVPIDQSLAILEEAREIAPDDPAVATEQGRALLALGRSGDALVAFGRALALNPSDATALNNRGAALLALGQIQAARADFERALVRDPCLFDARFNLARTGKRTPDLPRCLYTPDQKRQLEDH
jgi:tetratricopeptide (TPR) repeat protein